MTWAPAASHFWQGPAPSCRLWVSDLGVIQRNATALTSVIVLHKMHLWRHARMITEHGTPYDAEMISWNRSSTDPLSDSNEALQAVGTEDDGHLPTPSNS